MGVTLKTGHLRRIVSGGQTGTDRAALDWAISRGVPTALSKYRGQDSQNSVVWQRPRPKRNNDGYFKIAWPLYFAPQAVENENPPSPLPPGSDPSSLLGDLLEAARRRNLSGHSLLAYQRAWIQFLSWAAANDCDPRQLSGATALQAYAWLSEGKGPATIKQLRAALSFAFRHWDLKNPFAQIEPPIHNEPQIHYLMLTDVRRLLAHLRSLENDGYGARLAFHLANALFLSACRFDELIQLEWSSCQRAGGEHEE